MAEHSNWTREEHILAFNLYCQIPFGSINSRNPKIQQLASLLGRTPSSVALKRANIARLDPVLKARGVGGMSHGAKGEEEIWKEFSERPEELALESERLRASLLGKTLEDVAGVEIDDLPKEGIERDSLVKIRVNQNFFRKRVLSLYGYQCCITGIKEQALLTASHIVPWSVDVNNRLNPRNGLCLNALHDRAFDRHLMWVEDDLTVHFSSKISLGDSESAKWFLSFEGKKLLLPKIFSPDPTLLARHAKIARSTK